METLIEIISRMDNVLKSVAISTNPKNYLMFLYGRVYKQISVL